MTISNRFCRFGGSSGKKGAPGWVARPPEAGDRAAWDELFAAYCAFYELPSTTDQRDRVWSWIEAGDLFCLLAVPADRSDGKPVGLAHVRPYLSPLRATVAGYLDDLFIDPEARGCGAFEALIAAIRELAVAQGWAMVRWITAADNARARAAYERVARRTDWVTYQLDA